MRSGDATRERILTAATSEFAEFGIAGARVERIAANARANKAQLYSFFGAKEVLFETVFSASLDDIVNLVPIDAKNLPEYAVRLYDEYLVHPHLVRLATWARLERRPTGHLMRDADDVHAGKLWEIAEAQRAGLIDEGLTPFEVLTTVIALSMTWSPAGAIYTATPAEDAATHERRRGVLRTLVSRAFSAPSLR